VVRRKHRPVPQRQRALKASRFRQIDHLEAVAFPKAAAFVILAAQSPSFLHRGTAAPRSARPALAWQDSCKRRADALS
jgi:hypothetical protein